MSSAGSRHRRWQPGKDANTAAQLTLSSREQMVRELQKELGSLSKEEIGTLWKPALGAWLRSLILGRSLESI